MDPISQGALGASLSQTLEKDPSNQRWALIFGFLGGMAADLDVLIRSKSDPLLFLEFHRQFTHSLIFIPIGGLISGFVLNLIFYKNKLSFKKVYSYSTFGYATHALLDSCTSYGTQLLWPFSNFRVAWNNVSIIDPLFTFPVLVLIIFSALKKRPSLAKLSFIYALIYLSLGVIQRERAKDIGYSLAAKRGHKVISLNVHPSFANLIVWKIIYETNSKYHIDAVRVFGDNKIYQGESLDKLNLKKDFPWLKKDSTQAKDIQRFSWFSKGFLTKSTYHQNLISDVRYSMLPNSGKALWGIKLSKTNQDKHVTFFTQRKESKKALKILLKMLLGKEILL